MKQFKSFLRNNKNNGIKYMIIYKIQHIDLVMNQFGKIQINITKNKGI